MDLDEHNAERGREKARLLKELKKLGQRYRRARTLGAEIRAEAAPIVVALAKLDTEQQEIARTFDVVRETIRRIEIAHGIDRGDPRIKPGSRGPLKKAG